jgi:hypothetical protein
MLLFDSDIVVIQETFTETFVVQYQWAELTKYNRCES